MGENRYMNLLRATKLYDAELNYSDGDSQLSRPGGRPDITMIQAGSISDCVDVAFRCAPILSERLPPARPTITPEIYHRLGALKRDIWYWEPEMCMLKYSFGVPET